MSANIVVVGIGNEWRGDDGVGLMLARRLRKQETGHVRVQEQSGDPAMLMEILRTEDNVILLDAVSSGKEAGTVHRWDACREFLPSGSFRCSSHALGVAEAIGMARAMGHVPKRLIVYGVEGKFFNMGTGLSPGVNEGLEKVLKLVETEIEELEKSCTNSH